MARIIIAGPCLLNIVATRPWRGSLPRDHSALFAKFSRGDDDDVYYYIGERLKLEGETENRGV